MKKFMGRTMAKMNENRRNGRKALKGFTLVEIIVVLVILAILAAAMIPALTGYIDKAKERTVIAEARNVLTAAQTLASEEYGLHGKTNLGADGGKWYSGDDSVTPKIPSAKAKILELADVTYKEGSTDKSDDMLGDITLDKAKITSLVYTTLDEAYTVTYNGTEFTVVANED